MNPAEFLEEVESGEGQTLEFKMSLSQCDRGLKALCGMINAEQAQGAVWFGVKNDGELVGIEQGNLDSAQQKLAQKTEKFDPPIQTRIEVVECEGKSFIRLGANRSRSVSYHEYDGRAFIREGSRTRRLSRAEKQALEMMRNRDKHTGPWRCDKCGSMAMQVVGVRKTDQGVTKSYRCSCGGEFWPIT